MSDTTSINANTAQSVKQPGTLLAADASLRDYFAAKALQGMVTSQQDVEMRGHPDWRDEFSREAYRYADAMLAAREDTP